MEDTIRTSLRGSNILREPRLNKSNTFTQKERDLLGLNGLLPFGILTIEQQIARCYQNFNQKRTPIGKYLFLSSLLNQDESLFYQFVSLYPSEMLPFIYTPTVGEAATQFSRIVSNHRGLYLSYPLEDKMEEMIQNLDQKEVKIIVVTDGERILGLGDLGVGGISIPIGKLSLFTLFGGIHPNHTLPIVLDVGTNRKELLEDELYLGWRHERIDGVDYERFIDKFVKTIKKKYPDVLLQWEDFGKIHARTLLDRYRKEILSFNDDIQGTAAVSLAAILAGLKEIGAKLCEQKIAILGAGSAGTGIADLIVQAMIAEGISREEAQGRIYMVDRQGLIHFNTAHVYPAQYPYRQPHQHLINWKVTHFDHITMQEVIINAHPTILIGVSAQGGAFTKSCIEEMCKHVKRPLIFPLSNPTSKAEATPQEILEWSQGQAIVATGSPFSPVVYQNKTYKIAQCNNVYIFPGIGLGALAAQAKEITESMFLQAAETLASLSPALKDPTASLFPEINQVRSLTRHIAVAVAQKACEENLARIDPSSIEINIDSLIWKPHYHCFT